VLLVCVWVPRSAAAQEPPPVEGVPVVPPPPPFSAWFAQTRWDEALAVERAAGYDKLKIAEAIQAWDMYLNLYPSAGMANEAAWHAATLSARYPEVDKVIGVYERYLSDFPDGDYASDALWSLTYQYLRIPDWDATLARYDEFLKRFGQSPYGDEALNGLASRALTVKNRELALELYSQLLERYPTSDYCDDALSAIGGIYADAYEVDRAAETFFRLANEYPYSNLVESGLEQLIVMYYRTNPMAAVQLGQEFLARFPHSYYTKYVQLYMYYASLRLRVSVPGMRVERPDLYGESDEPDEYEEFRKAHDEAFHAAQAAYNRQSFGEAVRLYGEFLAAYPNSDKTDDALYWIGQAYDALETYATAGTRAKTPEQLGQVSADWQGVTKGFAEAVSAGQHPVRDAIGAYIVLSQSMPGSDFRDDALYLVGADFEKLEDWVSACNAYLTLISTYPVSSYANTAVTRLDALCPKLPLNSDRAGIMASIVRIYPHHNLADDYVYRLGVQAVMDGSLAQAASLFARYTADYPHRSLAPKALFWQARCEQLLGNGARARPLYAQLAGAFLQSGLADDGYTEYEYLRQGEDDTVVKAGLEALQRASAPGNPLIGYEAIARDHILLLVPSDKAMDARAYNLPDHLEQAYGRLTAFCGVSPAEGRRIEILVDAAAAALTPGEPIRVPVGFLGPPPAWRQWFEALALAFVNDPRLAPVTTALPGIGPGAARFAAVQLEDLLYRDLGEMNVGATALQAHLRDLNTTKNAAAAALSQHAQAKATADKIDTNIGLGMVWSFADRLAPVPGELIDWTPLAGLFPAAKAIPFEVAQQAQSLEQKSALATYWLNAGLGRDQTALLVSWGLPTAPEELARVKAAVEAAVKPPPP
jgi:TolA-binding protein